MVKYLYLERPMIGYWVDAMPEVGIYSLGSVLLYRADRGVPLQNSLFCCHLPNSN
jgi:hypothetical protein